MDALDQTIVDLGGKPTPGHNRPPLAELLTEETADLKQRADDLMAGAGRCVVTDADSAQKATLLAGMIKAHSDKLETARKERKEPFLEAGRAVDVHYAMMRAPLDLAGQEVVAKVDTYRREQERLAAAERTRLENEARQAREAAEAAQRAAAAAPSVDAEIAVRQQEERAATLTRQAASVIAAPIDSGLGVKAFGRKVWTGRIVDLKVALRHAMKIEPATIEMAVQAILDRQVRAKVRTFPGAEITEDTATTIRKGA